MVWFGLDCIWFGLDCSASELVMNVLRKRVPVSLRALQRLLPHRGVLRDMALKKLSIRKRRQSMMHQSESELWPRLRTVCDWCVRGPRAATTTNSKCGG